MQVRETTGELFGIQREKLKKMHTLFEEFKRGQKETLQVLRFHIANPEIRLNVPSFFREDFIQMKD